ncbi:hypothetical protein ISCGN_014402 [Ixodes scapularis]
MDTMRVITTEMQESLTFVSSQYDSLINSMKTQEKEVKELQVKTNALRTLIADQALEIQQLRDAQNYADQSNLLANLEIYDIPFSARKNLEGFITDLEEQLNIEGFQPTHAEEAHRLPARRDCIPPILVRFSSLHLKERLMVCRSRLRSLPP